jgi:hypothetical protein
MTKMNVTAAIACAAGCCVSLAGADDGSRTPAVRGPQLTPAYMIVNGRRLPVPIASSTTRDILPIYDNGIGTPATGAFTTTSLPNWHTMDDISFNPGPGAGAGRTLTEMTFAIAHVAAANPATDPVACRMRMWDTLNTANNPVTSDSRYDATFVFNAPAGGWAANTYYPTPAIDLTTAVPAVTTTDDAIWVDQAYFTVSGGNPTTTPDTDFSCIFAANTGDIHTAGSSALTYYRDADGSGSFQSGELRNFAAPAVANFILQLKADVPPLATGACCATDGTCSSISQGACTFAHGAYQGDNIACGTCFTGSCCLPDGTCVTLSPGGCTLQSGIYGGNNSSCGTCTQPAVLVNNAYTGGPPLPESGVFRTGASSASGIPAPFAAGAATQWSELQPQTASCNDTILGFNGSGTFRLADNFTLASSSTIQKVVVYPLLANNTSDPFATANFTSATLQIWNGRPGDAGSTIVFGDTTTNRLAASGAKQFAYTYRTGWTGGGANVTPNFPVYRIAIDVNATFPAGNYWLDWSVSGPTANFEVAATIAGEAGGAVPGANARQFVAATPAWTDVLDTGNPANCGSVQQDLAFLIVGTGSGPTCYANCDNSTAIPFLNVQDFSCFLTKYAAGNSYANCDNSTTIPTLNVQDFSCFLTKYAAGCSAP